MQLLASAQLGLPCVAPDRTEQWQNTDNDRKKNSKGLPRVAADINSNASHVLLLIALKSTVANTKMMTEYE